MISWKHGERKEGGHFDIGGGHGYELWKSLKLS